MSQRVGIVVPTLGTRPQFLTQCLESIRQAGEAHVCLVAPKEFSHKSLLESGLIDQFVLDPGSGLPNAINAGFSELPPEIEYINWLGDDDLLTTGSLEACMEILDSRNDVVMVFGACDYVDTQGDLVWRNYSGAWAVPLLRFGPDLIPQPGSLFRRSTFEQAGGLRTNLGWAFDFDLFIRLSMMGKIAFLNKTLAQFRWHPESLSVEHRKRSVSEASQVRISHLPAWLRPISFLWEYPVTQATLIAGTRVTAKANSKAQSS